MKLSVACLICLSLGSLAAVPIGIIGGQDTTATTPYAALVAADGTLTPVSGTGFPPNGNIQSVAINISGRGIIGGDDTAAPYASFVAPDGTLVQITGIPTLGDIQSVAINNSGMALIGGQENPGRKGYAALVAPDGTVTALSGTAFPTNNGRIFSVAINSAGQGIIGGRDQSPLGPSYAALVASNGTLTYLSGVPPLGIIDTVAINSSGHGIIGGVESSSPFPGYAAFVAPDGTLTPLSVLQNSGTILSVAINQSGVGLIGGQDGNLPFPAFAALVSPTGTVTPLNDLPQSNSLIESVAINNTGAGIIGGSDNFGTGPAFAALVSPSGTLTALSGLPPAGDIGSVAINDAGVGLIGGQDFNLIQSFAALVAPNGTVTPLSGTGFPFPNGVIRSVGMGLADVLLNAVTPQSVGPSGAAVNTQLMAAEALEMHLTSQNSLRAGKVKKEKTRFGDAGSHVLVAAAGDPVLQEYKRAGGTYTLWASPFGDYLHQRKQGTVPSFTNKVVGGLLGFDYHPSNYLVGGGVAYAFNHVHFGQHLGHGNLNEEMAFAYYGYYATNVWFNVAAWGGLYQFHNFRHAPLVPTSSAHIHGWIFDPHAEVATPITFDWLIVEPFAMADWVMNWQNSFKEKNLSGFAVRMGSQHNSLLRSEAGLRFYETIRYEWGKFVLEEKASYINRTPFGKHRANVRFVGSASSFPVAITSSHIQNLGGAELRAMFLPWDNAYPYGIIDAQAEVGSSFQSYFLSLEIGKNF